MVYKLYEWVNGSWVNVGIFINMFTSPSRSFNGGKHKDAFENSNEPFLTPGFAQVVREELQLLHSVELQVQKQTNQISTENLI